MHFIHCLMLHAMQFRRLLSAIWGHRCRVQDAGHLQDYEAVMLGTQWAWLSNGIKWRMHESNIWMRTGGQTWRYQSQPIDWFIYPILFIEDLLNNKSLDRYLRFFKKEKPLLVVWRSSQFDRVQVHYTNNENMMVLERGENSIRGLTDLVWGVGTQIWPRPRNTDELGRVC